MVRFNRIIKTISLKGIIPLYIKVLYLLEKCKMPSNNGVMVYLGEKDKKLFEKAVKKYKIGQSKLLKEIIHAWLFANKLQIQIK